MAVHRHNPHSEQITLALALALSLSLSLQLFVFIPLFSACMGRARLVECSLSNAESPTSTHTHTAVIECQLKAVTQLSHLFQDRICFATDVNRWDDDVLFERQEVETESGTLWDTNILRRSLSIEALVFFWPGRGD